MVEVLDFSLEVGELEIKSIYYGDFRNNTNPPALG